MGELISIFIDDSVSYKASNTCNNYKATELNHYKNIILHNLMYKLAFYVVLNLCLMQLMVI